MIEKKTLWEKRKYWLLAFSGCSNMFKSIIPMKRYKTLFKKEKMLINSVPHNPDF